MAIPLRRDPELIDPHGGSRGSRSRLAARPAPALVRRRPDPGAAGRPLRGPLRLRAGARDRRAVAPGGPEHGLGRSPRGGAAATGRRGRGGRGFALLADWGLVEPHRRRRRAGEPRRRTADGAALEGDRPARPRRPRRRAGSLGRGGGTGGGGSGAAVGGGRAWRREASPIELVLARALGAEWLDRYLREWRAVALEIDGERPDRRRSAARARQSAAASTRRCAASSTARSPGATQELAVALAAARRTAMEWRRATGCAGWRRALPGARAAFSTRSARLRPTRASTWPLAAALGIRIRAEIVTARAGPRRRAGSRSHAGPRRG